MPYVDKEKEKKYRKKYREDHKEQLRQYNLEHREHLNRYRREWRANNSERNKTSQKRYYTTVKGRFMAAKYAANKRGKIFTISLAEYQKIILNPCYYCNNQLGDQSITGSGLDRINNLIGYELGNIISCCWTCNKIKNDTLTCEEAKAAVDAVLKLRSLTVNKI
jgi:hypothetical protein